MKTWLTLKDRCQKLLLVFTKLEGQEDVRSFGDVARILQRRGILFKDPFITEKREREERERE